MYQIPLDIWNYHTNCLTEQEKCWGLEIYDRTVRKSKDLFDFTERELRPLGFQKHRRQEFLTTVILAFCHTMQDRCPPKNEAQLDKTVRKWLHIYLPYIVRNLQVMHPSHPVQYEPVALSCLYLSDVLRNAVGEHTMSEKCSGNAYYLYIEFNNLLRAMGSSLLLLTTGDDVHGAALSRGVFEIYAKLLLAEEFLEEFVLFIDFNEALQTQKCAGEPLPPKMKHYLKNCPEAHGNLEKFLSYGWAKDEKGNRILKLSDLMKTAYQKCPALSAWMNVFVHENYAMVGYDYPYLRKMLIETYFGMYRTFLRNKNLRSLLPQRECGIIKSLMTSVSPLCGTEYNTNFKY